jgi:hypothetical protein
MQAEEVAGRPDKVRTVNMARGNNGEAFRIKVLTSKTRTENTPRTHSKKCETLWSVGAIVSTLTSTCAEESVKRVDRRLLWNAAPAGRN